MSKTKLIKMNKSIKWVFADGSMYEAKMGFVYKAEPSDDSLLTIPLESQNGRFYKMPIQKGDYIYTEVEDESAIESRKKRLHEIKNEASEHITKLNALMQELDTL